MRRICCFWDNLVTADLYVLAISETWLTVDHGDEDLGSLCPAGCTFSQSPGIGRRGGGYAIVEGGAEIKECKESTVTNIRSKKEVIYDTQKSGFRWVT